MEKKLKPCCSDSYAQGMAYCLQCGDRLLFDEDTIIKSRSVGTSPTRSNARFYLGMLIVCLVAFGAVISADYLLHRKLQNSVTVAPTPSPVQARSSPSPEATPKQTVVVKVTPVPKATQKPTPKGRPKRDAYDDLLDEVLKKDDLEKYLDPLPTPSPVKRSTPKK